MRRALPLAVLLACGSPAEPKTTASRPPPASKSGHATTDEEALARAFAERGILDVAAEHARRAFEAKRTPEAKRAYGLALADAWAFEKAREVLGDDPALALHERDLAAIDPDGARVDRALRALAARDGKTTRAELEPMIVPRATPLVLELAGRARLLLGEEVEARKAFSRARSRADAVGAHIGMLATAPGAIDSIDIRDGRLVASRARERYLVGGYQSNRTHTMWIESYAIGDADPLVRFPVGNLDGVAISADGTTVAILDRPLDMLVAPVPETARLLDLRTGHENQTWDATETRMLRWYGASLLTAHQRDVIAWDATGHVVRTLPITGKTPGMMRVYRAGRGTMHDNIPMTYDSQPVTIEPASDGTVAVGATDGVVWIWPKGAKDGFALKPAGALVDDQDANLRRPIAMRFDDSMASLLVATGDGAVTKWDLAQRKAQRVVEPRCTDSEFEGASFGQPPTPEALARCAQARNATFSPDGTRVVFASMLGGPRVRDAKTGAAISTLDTLAADAITFADRNATAWFGGVEGTIDRWDVTAGKRLGPLEQGGILGFMQSISRDGRYVSIGEASIGYRTSSIPKVQIWDTTLHRAVTGLPSDVAQASFVDRAVALVSTREHGAFLWDLSTSKRITELAKGESGWMLSDDLQRIVSLKSGSKVVLRDAHAVLREIDIGSSAWGLAIDRSARTAATVDESGQVAVFDLDAGRAIFRIPGGHGAAAVALSPDGHAVAWRDDPKTIVVTSVDDKKEIARITSKDLAPDADYEPIRAVAFASDTMALLVGPGAPGYERIYEWTIGGKAVPTELQVLGGEQIELWPNGVAAIHDRNDTIHLLRISDGKLLASVYATRGAGWLAMSREGAVDGSPEGRSAAITIADGNVAMGRSSWLGWDRFEVLGLLERAARGEIVAPAIAAHVERSDTMTGRKN